jgi:hypothetical protein
MKQSLFVVFALSSVALVSACAEDSPGDEAVVASSATAMPTAGGQAMAASTEPSDTATAEGAGAGIGAAQATMGTTAGGGVGTAGDSTAGSEGSTSVGDSQDATMSSSEDSTTAGASSTDDVAIDDAADESTPRGVSSAASTGTPASSPADPSGGAGEALADAGSEPIADEAGAASEEAFDGKELFILFGQSNMSGMSPMPDSWTINENITFMVQYDCPSLGQTKDEWLPAEPPLHGCQWATGGIGLGLADYFGVAMAEAWADSQIGLIPNAIPAVTIDIFMKGGPSPGGGAKALPDGYTSAYTLMVDRAKEAQKIGRIRGILLHQGESDYNQGFGEEWLGKLTTVVADLRADLGLDEDEVPFLAGQIPPGNYDGHNVYVDQVPGAIPNSAVISSEGTRIHDVAHFDQESAQIMGQRYAETFLEFVPRP